MGRIDSSGCQALLVLSAPRRGSVLSLLHTLIGRHVRLVLRRSTRNKKITGDVGLAS